MSEIAVIHMDLMARGGGEAVAMTVLETLQDDHDVTLLTLTDPDLPALNEYFNTAVADVDVRSAGVVAPRLNAAFGLRYYVLQNALLGRYARRHADEYDLLVSTINELGLGSGSVQYVHFPFDWTVSLDDRDRIFHPTVPDGSLYERVCTAVAGVDPAALRSSALLANSGWTASVVEDAYGTRPAVLHPPVDTSEFVDRPWASREPGFVVVGRIERSKRILELIEVVDRVRDRGHDVHLHVVGPTVDETYYREVEARAASRPHVVLDGELPRSELVERVCSHRYGIHGKEYEHFGMAVAELAAGGTIPFVPATGGAHAVVRDRPELLYGSVDDAVEKIHRVLSEPALQRELRFGPAEVERRFGRDRFRDAFDAVVARALADPAAGDAAESVRTVLREPAADLD